MKKALALLVITALSVLAQIPKPGGGGGPAGSGATSLDGLTDVAVGSSPPGTCTDNHYYVDTSESVPADMLKVCRSNTWYKVSELTGSNCIDVVGRDISLCSSVPLWSGGASDPSGANTAGEWYLQTTTKDLWIGEGGTTWRRLTGSVFALVDTGGDDTYGNSTACAGFPATYVDGQTVILQATTANTGAATLDCRPGAKAIKLPDGTTDPTTGDVVAFKPTVLQYKSSADGGSGAWILLVPGASSSSSSGAQGAFSYSGGMTRWMAVTGSALTSVNIAGISGVGTSSYTAGANGVPPYRQLASAASVDADAADGISNVWTAADDAQGIIWARFPEVANRRIFVGFTQSAYGTHQPSDTGGSGASFAGFRCSSNASDTNWQAITKDGTTAATTDTGVACDTNAHVFEVGTTDGGVTWVFKIDGATVATRTTNVPNTAALMYLVAYTRSLNGTAANLHYSFFQGTHKPW